MLKTRQTCSPGAPLSPFEPCSPGRPLLPMGPRGPSRPTPRFPRFPLKGSYQDKDYNAKTKNDVTDFLF